MGSEPRRLRLDRMEERFWEQVEIREGDECWDWLGYVNPSTGYGQFTLNTAERRYFDLGRVVSAPVLSCTLQMGRRQLGQVVMHACDDRICVNPYHLRWGSQAQNMAQARARGRHRGNRKVVVR